MLRKAQQGSAGGAQDGWPLVAALLACLPIMLVSAADAVAALPAAAAIPITMQRAAEGATAVATPIREAAGHAVAALPAAEGLAAPGPGATSIAGHSAQLTAGDATQAVKTATRAPSSAGAGAGVLTAVAKALPAVEDTHSGGLPPVARAVPAVEHTATRAGRLTEDLAAGAESSGSEPRQLLGSTAQSAGGLGPAASRRSRAIESPVPRPASALKSAARPAAGAITLSPSRHSAGAAGGGLRLGTVARASTPARPGAASLAAARAELAAATAGRHPALFRSPLTTAHAARGRPEQSMNGLSPIDPRVLTSVARIGPLLAPAAPLTAGAVHRRGAVGAVARLPGPAGTGPMPVTSGGPGSAAGGFGVAFSIFLALAGFLLIALVGAMRRLRLCAEPWRAAPYVLIPERPG